MSSNVSLKELSISALKSLAQDIRIQVGLGLFSNKEAHDRINVISVVLMQKEMAKIEEDIAASDLTNEEYDDYLFRESDGIPLGDELMTNGWAD
jgi:hypothetical protein